MNFLKLLQTNQPNLSNKLSAPRFGKNTHVAGAGANIVFSGQPPQALRPEVQDKLRANRLNIQA